MKKKMIVLMCCLTVIFAWAYEESYRVTVTRVDMRDSNLAPVLHGKTVVQLSDLHMHGLGYREEKVFTLLNALKPDLILLTGDYITWDGDVQMALSFLARLKPTLGAYGVMGDYDYSNSRRSCLFCHQENTSLPTQAHTVRMLQNETVRIKINNRDMWITGLDDSEGEENRIRQLGQGDDTTPMIVLCHNPLIFDELDDHAGVLMLSGDTHGGQLYLPAFVWRLIGYEKNARYNRGVFHKGKNTLNVSKGVGTSHLPFRFFCPPEIVVYTF